MSEKTEAHEENPIVLSLARSGVRVRDISNNKWHKLQKSFIYDSKSGVIDEATPETYVEDIYAKPVK